MWEGRPWRWHRSWCPLGADVEVVGVEAVVVAELSVAQTELLGGVVVCALRAGPVHHRPVGDGLLDRWREVVAEEVVDAPDDTHRVGDELAVVHVVESVFADARSRRDGLFDTNA